MRNSLVFCCLLFRIYKAFAIDGTDISESNELFCEQDKSDEDQKEAPFQASNERDCALTTVNLAYLRAIEGNGIGYNTGYTTFGLLLSPARFQNKSFLPFIDTRGHYFNNNRWAANLGVGIRHFSSAWRKTIGYNFFYDFRQTHTEYNQIGVGIEMLGLNYDIRLNGYLPVGNKTSHGKTHKFTYPGGYFVTYQSYRKALCGGDAEIEASLNRRLNCPSFNPYIALGPYFYYQDYEPNIIGGKCRLGFNYLTYITCEVKASYDTTFRLALQGLLAITFTFDSNSIAKMRIAKPVERQEIIVESNKQYMWETNY